jgi:hypothetical protein
VPRVHWVEHLKPPVPTFMTWLVLLRCLRPRRRPAFVHFDGDDDDDETELPWKHMVDVCANHPGHFTWKEQQFLETLQRWRGEPTPKQMNWLIALFERVHEAA